MSRGFSLRDLDADDYLQLAWFLTPDEMQFRWTYANRNEGRWHMNDYSWPLSQETIAAILKYDADFFCIGRANTLFCNKHAVEPQRPRTGGGEGEGTPPLAALYSAWGLDPAKDYHGEGRLRLETLVAIGFFALPHRDGNFFRHRRGREGQGNDAVPILTALFGVYIHLARCLLLAEACEAQGEDLLAAWNRREQMRLQALAGQAIGRLVTDGLLVQREKHYVVFGDTPIWAEFFESTDGRYWFLFPCEPPIPRQGDDDFEDYQAVGGDDQEWLRRRGFGVLTRDEPAGAPENEPRKNIDDVLTTIHKYLGATPAGSQQR